MGPFPQEGSAGTRATIGERSLRPRRRESHAAQGSEHVFRSGNQRAFMVAQNRRQIGGGDGFRDGRNFAVGLIKAGTDKNKTRIDRCGPKRQTDRQTGMNADTRDGGLRTKRGLTAEFHR